MLRFLGLHELSEQMSPHQRSDHWLLSSSCQVSPTQGSQGFLIECFWTRSIPLKLPPSFQRLEFSVALTSAKSTQVQAWGHERDLSHQRWAYKCMTTLGERFQSQGNHASRDPSVFSCKIKDDMSNHARKILGSIFSSWNHQLQVLLLAHPFWPSLSRRIWS